MLTALILSMLAGCAALSYEMLSARRVIDLVGASNDSIALVLGLFLFGLALGGVVARRLIRLARNPWRLAGRSAFLAFIFTIPTLYVTSWTSGIWQMLGPERTISWCGTSIKWLLSISLIIPPALFMGMVLPLLACASMDERHPMRKWGVFLYASSTLGGVIGVVMTSFFLLPRSGVLISGWITAALNMLVALICFLQGAGSAPRERPEPEKLRIRAAPLATTLILLASMSGVLVMAIELIVMHQFDQILPTSVHSAAVVLTLVLISLAAGSAIARVFRNYRRALAGVMWAAAVLVVLEPFLLIWLSDGLENLPLGQGIGEYVAAICKIGFVGIVPMFTVLGMFFPIVFSWASEAQKDRDGRGWGTLLFFSGLGAVVGAQIAQTVLMPLCGIWQSMGVLAFMYAGGSCLIKWRTKKKIDLWWTCRALTIPSLAGVLFALASLPVHHPRGNEKIIDVMTGREGVVVTTSSKGKNLRVVLNNTYGVGGTSSAMIDRRQMTLPLMLHPEPEVIGVIGMGTGLTADAALEHDVVKRLECIEISPLIVRMARRHFPPHLHGLFTDPRSRIIITDGRLYAASCKNRFDVVVGDLFVPWRAGIGRLYTVEHFSAVKNAMREGGIFCQWLPLYQLTEAQVASIMKTFKAAFPDAWMIRSRLAYRNPFLGLLGFKGQTRISWEGIQKRCAQVRGEGRFQNVFVRQPHGIAMHLLGPIREPDSQDAARLNTLNNAWFEHQASLDVLQAEYQPFVRDRWRAYTKKCISELSRTGMLPQEMISSIVSAQAWVEAQHAHFYRTDTVKSMTIKAIRSLPSRITEDPFFDWKDFLTDVPMKLYGQRGRGYEHHSTSP